MSKHKFKVGENVFFMAPMGLPAPAGAYRIVKLLPPNLEEPLYRIRSEHEAYERSVSEAQLRRVAQSAPSRRTNQTARRNSV